MKYAVPAAFALIGTLALAIPASAQIVNGGATPTAEAPVGTKGGGAASTAQAPGEAAAVQGAVDNAQASNLGKKKARRHRTTSDMPSSGN